MNEGRPDEILKILQDNGHEAYYVGGCVRDTLLGRPVHDWDITTSALPEQIMGCFEHCIPTGIKHGTVTVIQNGHQAEVTTYRTDGSYCDGRHPEEVVFVRSLEEDLARRDFTINAMAMDLYGNVTDLYCGKEDIKNKTICCVGNPDKRFREDALRMLRAMRFASQLGFEIEEKTKEAIKQNAKLSEKLSAERVRDELEKTLCSEAPVWLDSMAEAGLLERCAPTAGNSCKWIKELPDNPTVRWAALCHTWPNMDLAVLRLSKKTTQDAMVAARCIRPDNELQWKMLLAEHGEVRSRIVASIYGEQGIVEKILQSGHCVSLRQLAVTGADFPALSGPELGAHLQRLLLHVLKHPEDNEKQKLKSMI